MLIFIRCLDIKNSEQITSSQELDKYHVVCDLSRDFFTTPMRYFTDYTSKLHRSICCQKKSWFLILLSLLISFSQKQQQTFYSSSVASAIDTIHCSRVCCISSLCDGKTINNFYLFLGCAVVFYFFKVRESNNFPSCFIAFSLYSFCGGSVCSDQQWRRRSLDTYFDVPHGGRLFLTRKRVARRRRHRVLRRGWRNEATATLNEPIQTREIHGEALKWMNLIRRW